MTHEEAIKFIEGCKFTDPCTLYGIDNNLVCDMAIRALKDIDTLKAKQSKIIRCKNCRYWDDQLEQDKFRREHHSTMPCIEMATSGDFYCMFGKLKEGEQE